MRLSKLPARTVEARLDYQEKGKEKLSENRSLPPVVASARELAASSRSGCFFILRDERAQAAAGVFQALCSSDDDESQLASLPNYWAPGRPIPWFSHHVESRRASSPRQQLLLACVHAFTSFCTKIPTQARTIRHCVRQFRGLVASNYTSTT